MLTIRLTRMGKKKKAYYRVVVAEKRQARDGSFVEILGHYNPQLNPPAIKLDMDRVRHWIQHGAQASETVRSLIHKAAPPAAAS